MEKHHDCSMLRAEVTSLSEDSEPSQDMNVCYTVGPEKMQGKECVVLSTESGAPVNWENVKIKTEPEPEQTQGKDGAVLSSPCCTDYGEPCNSGHVLREMSPIDSGAPVNWESVKIKTEPDMTDYDMDDHADQLEPGNGSQHGYDDPTLTVKRESTEVPSESELHLAGLVKCENTGAPIGCSCHCYNPDMPVKCEFHPKAEPWELDYLFPHDSETDTGPAVKYPCPHCTKEWKTESSLTAHIHASHGKILSYLCEICGFLTSGYWEFGQHRRLHRMKFCPTCKIVLFLEDKSKHKHEVLDSCNELVEQVAETSFQLRRNPRRNYGIEKQVKGNLDVSKDDGTVNDDKISSEATDTGVNDDASDSGTELVTVRKKKLRTPKLYTCRFCPKTLKAFTRRMHYQTHLHVAHQLSPYWNCESCGNSYVKARTYAYHLRQHDRVLWCNTCCKELKTRSLEFGKHDYFKHPPDGVQPHDVREKSIHGSFHAVSGKVA